MRVRLPFLLLTAAVALSAACTESPAPTAVAAGPLALISDGTSGGNSHFFFLAPIVPEAGTAGANDDALDPAVVICAWDGAACGAVVATFTTDPGTTTTQAGNSETVRRSDNHFIVDWHTDAFELDPAVTYRVCVKVGDGELGFADVDLAASGRELRIGAEGYVTILDGRTLPIRFRIEAGALEQATTGTCSSDPGQPT